MNFLEELAARRRFGMKPGLDSIRAVCAALGNPQERFRAIHVAGTNGKGAVCAILDAALRATPAREKVKGKSEEVRCLRIGRYTSPHLVRLNERFFLDGAPVDDATLDRLSSSVSRTIEQSEQSNNRTIQDLTFFEALTAVAFLLYAEAKVDYAILECGLGGRLDATNVCNPVLSVITKIGLDHCDWLGDTVEKIAAEKAGVVKPGVPVVLGRNAPSVRAVVEARAKEVGAPFFYAPDLADEGEIPGDFSLVGSFNRENAVTALAVLKALSANRTIEQSQIEQFSRVVWPGRFQRVGNFIVDGAHNPPAARALAEALRETIEQSNNPNNRTILICGFCGDKDVDEVLSILAPFAERGYAVRTNNPRSLSAEATAAKMRQAGISAVPCASLRSAIEQSNNLNNPNNQPILICGSLFLAGEALVELGAYPWPAGRFDPSERLRADMV